MITETMIKQIEAKDIIAIVLIIGCIILLGMGKDGFIAALLALVVGYYFGYRRPFMIHNNKK